MAADSSTFAVNGDYAPTSYEVAGPSYDNPSPKPVDYLAPDVTAANGSDGGNGEIPKDEVAWFFVEKYYTTLSKEPEKLYLFYNKYSQYVSGTETEKVPVCVGQKAINDRIKELDIQDCKVRVTNVDSQASRSNIVIQVIGEISNKSAPQQKFTQTFVLAEQTKGYFVLHDIFRYLLDDEEEVAPADEDVQPKQVDAALGYQEPSTIATESVPQALTSSGDVQEEARDAAIIEQAIDQPIASEPDLPVVPSVAVNGVDALPTAEAVEETPSAAIVVNDEPAAEVPEVAEAASVEEDLLAEEPEDKELPPTPAPAQTVAAPAPARAPAAPAVAPKSNAPKTWANLVAGSRSVPAVAPAVPVAASASPSIAAKTTPPIQTQAPPTPIAPAASTPTAQESDQVDTPQSSGSEWQTAGADHTRKQSRTVQGAQTPADNSRAYIKNVNENIDVAGLQAALAKISEVSYLDINRQKNCAFVDFATPAGYRAAVAANPHEVSGERLYVEERRIRPPGSFPGTYNNNRAPSATRGTPRPPTLTPGRGGFQKDGARGGSFPARGRGNMGPRGRGGVSQAT